MPTLKGGRIELTDISVPTVAMPPGAAFEVRVLMENHASIIVGDPDGCANAGTPCTGTVDGYCVNVETWVEGMSPQHSDECLNLPVTGIPPRQEEYVYTLTAPSSDGTHTVSARAALTASDEMTNPLSNSITVNQSAVVPDSDRNADGSVKAPDLGAPGSGGQPGGGGLLGGGIGQTALALGFAVVVIDSALSDD